MEQLNLKLYLKYRSDLSTQNKSKVLLIALNMPGYYSLPVRILSLIAHQSDALHNRFDTRFIEFPIDVDQKEWLQPIEAWLPDIIGLTVNIWNRNKCITLAESIKKTSPETVILVGGQEVTRSIVDYLELIDEFDYIIDGEGEIPFQQFLENWDAKTRTLRRPDAVTGLHYRIGDRTHYNGAARLIGSLDDIPSPVIAGLVPIDPKQKLGVMLEGSRGCPFHCSYCFEGSRKGAVRTASIDRLVQEIRYASDRGGSYFHIMDPILCTKNPKRLQALTKHIKIMSANRPKIVFSVEAYAEHISAEVAECLSVCAIIDVGLQSINPSTLLEIHRKYVPDKFRRGLDHLRQHGASFNIYLICGLPHETLLSYLRAILFVIHEKPTRVFFNELCLLNGTELRRRADEYGYRFDPDPPYLVRETNWMSQHDLTIAWSVSKTIERKYNLSTKGIYANLPWITDIYRYKGKKVTIYLNDNCSWECPNCDTNGSHAAEQRYNSQPKEIQNADVELYSGDVGDKNELVKLMGQLHLGGASRVRLTSPPRLMCDSEFITLLINRGLWHFRTFFSIPGNFEFNPEDHEPSLMVALENLNRTIALKGKAEIRPFVEVVILANDKNAAFFEKYIRLLISYNVSIITIVENDRHGNQNWIDEMSALFHDTLTPGSWLKLPQNIMRHALRHNKSSEEIVVLLDQLDLISREPNIPPCFQQQQIINGKIYNPNEYSN